MKNTKDWDLYQTGLSYKSKINLLSTADKNERFYSGKQWEGLKTSKLSLVILNVIKRIVDFKISMIMSDMISMQFSADGIADNTENEREIEWRDMAQVLSSYSKTEWENLKLDTMNENGLLDAALSGDMVSYWFWNDKIDAGNGIIGDLDGEKVDNCNYFPGDPNLDEVNNAYGPVQPYIILAFRKQVADVRKEAKENGVSKEDLLLICSDNETNNQMGDMAKTELDADGENGKCIVLLKLWVKDGTIWARKSTRNVIVRKDWDTGLHRYPVAVMNWAKRKGSAHGEADVTSMIENQIEINRTASMIARWVRLHGFPKVIFDNTRIKSWTNDMSVAIPVAGDIAGAANYIQAAQLSTAVMEFMTWFIQVTKEMAGANDAVLGEANPTNTSAIIVLQKATAVPLNSIKRRFYQYIEDIGLIWLDFWLTKYAEYPERLLTIKQDGVTNVIPFDANKLQGARLKLKIDIGPSTQWNEAAAVQTLDNLLQRDLITFIEYLKRVPNGLIPDRQGLIDARNGEELMDKEIMYALMANFVDSLSPEAQSRLNLLQQNEPDKYEQTVKQLILQHLQAQGNNAPPPQQTPNMPQPTQPQEQPRPYTDNVLEEGDYNAVS